jgi:hypothetical protein
VWERGDLAVLRGTKTRRGAGFTPAAHPTAMR